MRTPLTFVLAGLLAAPVGLLTTAPAAQQPQQQQQAPDSLQPRRDSAMNAVLRQIAGKEDQPAESVFTNVKLLGSMPAGRLVRIMNQGYSRNLGVTCAYCHNTDDYGSDEKKEKETARAMITMVGTISGELRKITTIKSDNPIVNCGTCHRGVPRPGARPPAGG